MNVLVLTSAKNLAEKLNTLNPELEYCALVVDDVEAAKKTLAQIGLPKNVICSMDELQSVLSIFSMIIFFAYKTVLMTGK